MLANNLANAGTAGYKGDREFYGLYVSSEAADPLAAGLAPSTMPVIERHWTDYSQGTLTPTGNPLDLALSGEGFFGVNGPSGVLYTRNGDFRLSAAGILTTAEGYAVRTVAGGVIQAGSSSPPEVSADGTVQQDGAVLGQLAIAGFQDSPALLTQGAGYFRAAPGAVEASVAGTEVQQGKIEAANISPAEGAVRLVSIMRQFEMLQKAILLVGEMNRKTVEEVARVGS